MTFDFIRGISKEGIHCTHVEVHSFSLLSLCVEIGEFQRKGKRVYSVVIYKPTIQGVSKDESSIVTARRTREKKLI